MITDTRDCGIGRGENSKSPKSCCSVDRGPHSGDEFWTMSPSQTDSHSAPHRLQDEVAASKLGMPYKKIDILASHSASHSMDVIVFVPTSPGPCRKESFRQQPYVTGQRRQPQTQLREVPHGRHLVYSVAATRRQARRFAVGPASSRRGNFEKPYMARTGRLCICPSVTRHYLGHRGCR